MSQHTGEGRASACPFTSCFEPSSALSARHPGPPWEASDCRVDTPTPRPAPCPRSRCQLSAGASESSGPWPQFPPGQSHRKTATHRLHLRGVPPDPTAAALLAQLTSSLGKVSVPHPQSLYRSAHEPGAHSGSPGDSGPLPATVCQEPSSASVTLLDDSQYQDPNVRKARVKVILLYPRGRETQRERVPIHCFMVPRPGWDWTRSKPRAGHSGHS